MTQFKTLEQMAEELKDIVPDEVTGEKKLEDNKKHNEKDN